MQENTREYQCSEECGKEEEGKFRLTNTIPVYSYRQMRWMGRLQLLLGMSSDFKVKCTEVCNAPLKYKNVAGSIGFHFVLEVKFTKGAHSNLPAVLWSLSVSLLRSGRAVIVNTY